MGVNTESLVRYSPQNIRRLTPNQDLTSPREDSRLVVKAEVIPAIGVDSDHVPISSPGTVWIIHFMAYIIVDILKLCDATFLSLLDILTTITVNKSRIMILPMSHHRYFTPYYDLEICTILQ